MIGKFDDYFEYATESSPSYAITGKFVAIKYDGSFLNLNSEEYVKKIDVPSIWRDYYSFCNWETKKCRVISVNKGHNPRDHYSAIEHGNNLTSMEAWNLADYHSRYDNWKITEDGEKETDYSKVK